ncbi:MAG: hypothetical protein C5B52_03440 [Bacteroidetes bacterium]|nr:MAG: hypothetical protein C5B52_03440 [Bacteroidota bacterium]
MKILLSIALVGFIISCNISGKEKNNPNLNIKPSKDSLLVTAEKFDSKTSDTKSNRERFREFFRFEPGADVNEIFCYSVSPDTATTYVFSFKCDSSTVARIVSSLELQKANFNSQISAPDFNFPWWNKSKIAGTQDRWTKVEDGLIELLWYDKTEGRVFFYDSDH